MIFFLNIHFCTSDDLGAGAGLFQHIELSDFSDFTSECYVFFQKGAEQVKHLHGNYEPKLGFLKTLWYFGALKKFLAKKTAQHQNLLFCGTISHSSEWIINGLYFRNLKVGDMNI